MVPDYNQLNEKYQLALQEVKTLRKEVSALTRARELARREEAAREWERPFLTEEEGCDS